MALSLSETKKVLDFIASIPKAGKSCIFIDHNIFHVYPVVDRIVVLDRGMIAGEFKKADVTLDELIERLYTVARTSWRTTKEVDHDSQRRHSHLRLAHGICRVHALARHPDRSPSWRY